MNDKWTKTQVLFRSNHSRNSITLTTRSLYNASNSTTLVFCICTRTLSLLNSYCTPFAFVLAGVSTNSILSVSLSFLVPSNTCPETPWPGSFHKTVHLKGATAHWSKDLIKYANDIHLKLYTKFSNKLLFYIQQKRGRRRVGSLKKLHWSIRRCTLRWSTVTFHSNTIRKVKLDYMLKILPENIPIYNDL